MNTFNFTVINSTSTSIISNHPLVNICALIWIFIIAIVAIYLIWKVLMAPFGIINFENTKIIDEQQIQNTEHSHNSIQKSNKFKITKLYGDEDDK